MIAGSRVAMSNPTMRVFRQPKIGDWAGVMREVAEELKNLVPSPRSPGKRE